MVTFWRGAKAPRTKYNARHTVCALGERKHSHDSMMERDRCFVLHILEERGEIRELRIHQRWPLEVNGVLITTYEDDFNYVDQRGSVHFVVEDVKGARTREYLTKRALMKAVYGIDILETP